jgi:Protein of unknown function (DUF1488)
VSMLSQRKTGRETETGTSETVSLEPVMCWAMEQFNGVVFFMTHHSNLLSVLATHGALREVAGKSFPDEQYLEWFEAFRTEFESTANDKFLSGRLEADGSIRIEASDVADIHRFAVAI